MQVMLAIINPRRVCAARVTVLGLRKAGEQSSLLGGKMGEERRKGSKVKMRREI